MNRLIATKCIRQITSSSARAPQLVSDASLQHISRRSFQSATSPPSLLRNSAPTLLRRHHQLHPAYQHHQQRRCESNTRDPRPLTDRPEKVPEPETPKEEQPAYEMTFTCRVCTDRSSHRITKQGYHHGTILITCPGCKNRHLIADHLKIFSDTSTTIEDILKEKGQLLKKGSLGAEGDVEFWEDGTQTDRTKKSD